MSESHKQDTHVHEHWTSSNRVQQKALIVVLVLTAITVIFEVVGGLAFKSLALVADATHMFSDSVALVIALIAQRIASRPASPEHSFGWRRAEVLAAQFNGILLLGASTWIAIEALNRFSSPAEVNGAGLMAVASIGLVVNLIAALILHRVPGQSMNIRAAALHTASDAAASAAALVTGLLIVLGVDSWIDPAMSMVIAVLVIFAAGRLVFDSVHVLLEGAPRHLDPLLIEQTLLAEPAVTGVHHLHLWSLAPGAVALSAHIELVGIDALHDAQAEGGRLKELLVTKFDIEHSTLELECHPCD